MTTLREFDSAFIGYRKLRTAPRQINAHAGTEDTIEFTRESDEQ